MTDSDSEGLIELENPNEGDPNEEKPEEEKPDEEKPEASPEEEKPEGSTEEDTNAQGTTTQNEPQTTSQENTIDLSSMEKMDILDFVGVRKYQFSLMTHGVMLIQSVWKPVEKLSAERQREAYYGPAVHSLLTGREARETVERSLNKMTEWTKLAQKARAKKTLCWRGAVIAVALDAVCEEGGREIPVKFVLSGEDANINRDDLRVQMSLLSADKGYLVSEFPTETLHCDKSIKTDLAAKWARCMFGWYWNNAEPSRQLRGIVAKYKLPDYLPAVSSPPRAKRVKR